MIYIDVDGVLADFHSHMDSLSNHPDLWSDDDVIHQVMDENFKVCFKDAKCLPNVPFFLRMYQQNPGQVKLLSAHGDFWSDHYHRQIAIKNKIDWVKSRGFSANDLILVAKSHEKLHLSYSSFKYIINLLSNNSSYQF